MSRFFQLLILTGIFLHLAILYCPAKTLVSHKEKISPEIDGRVDRVWEKASPTTTYDPLAKIDIHLRSLYTDTHIYFLVQFTDPNESRQHKMWHWDTKSAMYLEGPEREDSLVLKWALSKNNTDLTLKSERPYEADIWFWKACRTDPVGVADDKIQRLISQPNKERRKVLSHSGKSMYLSRKGDAGQSSYKTDIFIAHDKDVRPRFSQRKPHGSRADIQAKGHWKDGLWTIEMGRLLVTGHDDDINFHDLTSSYRFGVSRFEIAGRPMDSKAEEPLFGSGEITEHLLLQFQP